MSSEIAIQVTDLSKCYHIYSKPADRLLQMLNQGRKKFYQEFWAIQNVAFEVKKGETVGIVGRNGSGKSTLLQLICGTLNPTHGELQTTGRIAALLELGSGFNPEFTGRENVFMNGAILGLLPEEISDRYDNIVSFADIGDFINQPVKTYSSGMVVRLAFAVQAMIDPDILIVDEALAVGDEKFQRKCFSRLEELKSNGTSILFVSHSGPQVVELCDRALLLEQGTRLMYDHPMEVIRAYQQLIYAPADKQSHLISEYQAKDRQKSEPDEIKTGQKAIFSVDAGEQEANENPNEAIFDSGLVPETTKAFPIQGAEIKEIRILDQDGSLVNVLCPGKDYRFLVSGKFLTDAKEVFVGIHIRSISGIVITGQRHPEDGKYVKHVGAGKNFQITFGFRMILMPGVYFVGGGIWSSQDPNCLHRVLDAIMFRVLPPRKSKSFGYVDGSYSDSSLEIL